MCQRSYPLQPAPLYFRIVPPLFMNEEDTMKTKTNLKAGNSARAGAFAAAGPGFAIAAAFAFAFAAGW